MDEDAQIVGATPSDRQEASSDRQEASSDRQEALRPPAIRVGLGYDTHRLGDGGPLRLGGIDIPSQWHAIGHSDADVLLHAIVDSLLGAARLGDIGRLFPDTVAENRGRNSAEFLLAAIDRVREAGWEVINLDCVVLAQLPKLSPHVELICQRIAEITGLSPEQIGLKGKTGEQVGPVGRHEAIEARVVCLLWRPIPL